MFGSYGNSPLNAWAGWRLRIPGGPQGGQYHGFVAPDDYSDWGYGWPAGHDEIFRPIDNRAGLGIYPWQRWDGYWRGTKMMEGQTLSDFVYRSPAELRPRANASGGVNVVSAYQLQRSAGYAVAPGSYRALGAIAPPTTGPAMGPNPPERACPAWGCGGPPWARGFPPGIVQPVSPSPAPVVTQPPPPTSPQPSPTVPIGPAGSSGCAEGQYRDAAGNCTSDWTNPYPLYLPLDNTPSPAPVVPANTCPTGYSPDVNGNCVPAGSAGSCQTGYITDPTTGQCVVAGSSSSGIMAWLESDNATLSGMGLNVPNWGVAAVVGIVAVKFLRGGRR
jgi:hypothetical protein